MSTSIAVRKINTSISTISPDNKTTDDLKNSLVKSFDISKYIDDYNNDTIKLSNNHAAMLQCQSQIDSIYRYLLANQDHGHFPVLSSIETARKRLSSHYWKKVLEERNMFLFMSVKEKSKWTNVFNNLDTPDFTKENIILTFRDIANSSPKYFAERIVSTLSHLSKTHLTNSQFGFGEKLIFDKMHSGFVGDNYINASICVSDKDKNVHKTEYLDELRKIVAYLSDGNINSLEKMTFVSSYTIVEACLKQLAKKGKSEFTIDKDRIHLKVHKAGTIHVYISPEIAQKMNDFVAILYPNQIPSKFNKSYYKGSKNKNIIKRKHLSHSLIHLLRNLSTTTEKIRRSLRLEDSINFIFNMNLSDREFAIENNILDDFNNLVEYLGGKIIKEKFHLYEFDYDIKDVKDIISINGYIDDEVTFQQYYTKDNIAKIAYETLIDGYSTEKLNNSTFLEPSCGRGSLLNLLPKKNSLGIDISEINTSILKAKGFKTKCIDFVDFSNKTSNRFDFILLNPPYTKNQGYNHTLSAYNLLNENGTLVAILQSSQRGEFDFLKKEGAIIEESKDYEKCFDKTNVSVFILKISI
jgi:16S rRNA G966 N2-methylase RsmD